MLEVCRFCKGNSSAAFPNVPLITHLAQLNRNTTWLFNNANMITKVRCVVCALFVLCPVGTDHTYAGLLMPCLILVEQWYLKDCPQNLLYIIDIFYCTHTVYFTSAKPAI